MSDCLILIFRMMYPPHFPSKMKQMRFLQIPSSRRTNWSRYLFLVLIVGIAIILRVSTMNISTKKYVNC